MTLDMKHWKPSPVFPDRYLISDDGRLFNKATKKLIKPTLTHKGYYRYSLSYYGVRCQIPAHRLVALAFIPNPKNKPCVDHINTIRTDNRVDNLHWVTQSENMRNPLSYPKIRERGRSMIKEIRGDVSKATAVYKDGVLIKVFKSRSLAAEYVGITCKVVSACVCGRQKQSKGYVFKTCEIKNESEVMI